MVSISMPGSSKPFTRSKCTVKAILYMVLEHKGLHRHKETGRVPTFDGVLEAGDLREPILQSTKKGIVKIVQFYVGHVLTYTAPIRQFHTPCHRIDIYDVALVTCKLTRDLNTRMEVRILGPYVHGTLSICTPDAS